MRVIGIPAGSGVCGSVGTACGVSVSDTEATDRVAQAGVFRRSARRAALALARPTTPRLVGVRSVPAGTTASPGRRGTARVGAWPGSRADDGSGHAGHDLTADDPEPCRCTRGCGSEYGQPDPRRAGGNKLGLRRARSSSVLRWKARPAGGSGRAFQQSGPPRGWVAHPFSDRRGSDPGTDVRCAGSDADLHCPIAGHEAYVSPPNCSPLNCSIAPFDPDRR